MRSKITPLFAKFIADDVYDHFSSHANVYVGIGKTLDFGATEASVQEVEFTTNKLNQLYRNLVGLKKVTAADMQIVLARRDWTPFISYDAYEDDVQLFSFDDYTNIGTGNSNSNTVLTGTASITSSNIVTGTGTTFNTYIFPGDTITIDGQNRTVSYVHNTNYLIVSSAFSNTKTSQTVTLIANSNTIIGNSATFSSSLTPGDIVVIGEDERQVVSLRSNKVITLNSALSYSNSNVTLFKKSNSYPLYANNFYVRNTRDQVFKCLYNNNNATSAVEPTIDIDGQLPENPFITTSDGYKWKYMYTIAPGLKQKFFTDQWMPVSNDAAVLAASAEGRVDIINILWGGSGYQGGGNTNTAPILTITSTDGANANLVARVSNGVITAVTILNGGNNYTIGTVTVTDDTQLGSDTLGGTVNVAGTIITRNTGSIGTESFLGNVFTNDIVTVNSQARNVVTVDSATQITVNSAFTTTTDKVMTIQRSAAQFDIEFSPHGGHGSFPAEELGARSLMITMELDGDENGTIPMSTATNSFNFNQVCVLQDPLIANGAYNANSTNYRVSDRLFVSDPGVTNYADDETVYVGATLSQATMVANVAHWSAADNYLYINNITGTYGVSDRIKGETSGASATILEKDPSQIKKYTGEVLYISNRKNTTRNQNQIEQVKIVLTF